MTNEDKIAYLNQIIYSKFGIDYKGPKLLYKYRPFDEYTFDMLKNEYIFFAFTSRSTTSNPKWYRE